MTKLKFGLLLVLLSLVVACSGGGGSSSQDVTKENVITTYANIVLASYEDSLSTAEALQDAIQAFVDNPSETTLQAAKDAWLLAREPYGETEAYRFADGPIDDDNGPEGALNAWPLDEAYIDYVVGDSDSGLINDLSFTISKDAIKNKNEDGSETNISAGYHAIEFLLWGQDLSELDADEAGQRPYTDYVTGENGTALNQDRRAAYLLAVTELLIDDLTYLVEAWETGSNSNYRATFLALDDDEALTKILQGVATLSSSELSQERLAAPLLVGEREEEHSCFSDNTHNDVIYDARGIQNVVLGEYTRVNGSKISGPSFYDLLAKQNSTLASRLSSEVSASLTASEAIVPPFEYEISEGNTAGNARVQTVIDNLTTQGQTLVDAGEVFGLIINNGN